tara:strand:- start:201 stop:935 length:735 start_codon:yes stop_codon:yes gene_type:complete
MFIGKKPTDVPLTSSDIAADIINSTHIGDTAISGFTALTDSPASTDEFLISDGGTLKRLDASLVGGKDFEKLTTTTISANTTSVSLEQFTSDFRTYLLVGNSLIHDANSSTRMRFRQSSSDVTTSNYVWGQTTLRMNGSTEEDNNGQDDAAYFQLNNTVTMGTGTTTGRSTNFNMFIHDPLGTNNHKMISWNSFNVYDNGTAYYYTMHGIGIFRGNTTALSGITVYPSSGNYDSGYITIYGLKI